MTTKISILEKKIEVLNEQAQSIREQRVKCHERFQAAMTRCFDKYFRGVVSEDIIISCTSSGINFHKRNEENTFDKEIFSIYLKESWGEKESRYSDAQLNYYTTWADSDFELSRLENLGRVAQLMRNFKHQVVIDSNFIAHAFRAKLEESGLDNLSFELREKITNFEKEITELQKDEKRRAIFSEEGLKFEKPKCVQMKFNYAPVITSLKVINVSKSGKTGTAIFERAPRNLVGREENVNIERLLVEVV
jgi:hypothetical protein